MAAKANCHWNYVTVTLCICYHGYSVGMGKWETLTPQIDTPFEWLPKMVTVWQVIPSATHIDVPPAKFGANPYRSLGLLCKLVKSVIPVGPYILFSERWFLWSRPNLQIIARICAHGATWILEIWLNDLIDPIWLLSFRLLYNNYFYMACAAGAPPGGGRPRSMHGWRYFYFWFKIRCYGSSQWRRFHVKELIFLWVPPTTNRFCHLDATQNIAYPVWRWIDGQKDCLESTYTGVPRYM